MSNPDDFAARVSSLRKRLHLNQEDFAQRLGISRNYVSMIEGGREPSEALRRLIEVMEKQQGPQREATPKRLLKRAREEKGLSQKQLAQKAGYPTTAAYQEIEEGHSQMGEKMAKRIAKILDVPVEDLLSGSDHPPERGPIEGTFGTEVDIGLGPGMEGSKAKRVPLISMAECGRMHAYDDSAYAREGVVFFDVKDRNAFAVKLAGDSMTPKFDPGDVVLISPSQQARNGNHVIAKLRDTEGGDVMFKLYNASAGEVRLTSYNPHHPEIRYPKEAFEWIYPAVKVLKHLE